jgi:hypothetical protein
MTSEEQLMHHDDEKENREGGNKNLSAFIENEAENQSKPEPEKTAKTPEDGKKKSATKQKVLSFVGRSRP